MPFEAEVRLARSRFAANVRAARIARGRTQEQVAEAAGIEIRHLSDLENAQRSPSFRLLVVLADVLGVSPGSLFEPAERRKTPRGRPRKKPAPRG